MTSTTVAWTVKVSEWRIGAVTVDMSDKSKETKMVRCMDGSVGMNVTMCGEKGKSSCCRWK
jgi:hypothetical protein